MTAMTLCLMVCNLLCVCKRLGGGRNEWNDVTKLLSKLCSIRDGAEKEDLNFLGQSLAI
jgi:hypothetical protein